MVGKPVICATQMLEVSALRKIFGIDTGSQLEPPAPPSCFRLGLACLTLACVPPLVHALFTLSDIVDV
jgi:hypothetical protein